MALYKLKKLAGGAIYLNASIQAVSIAFEGIGIVLIAPLVGGQTILQYYNTNKLANIFNVLNIADTRVTLIVLIISAIIFRFIVSFVAYGHNAFIRANLVKSWRKKIYLNTRLKNSNSLPDLSTKYISILDEHVNRSVQSVYHYISYITKVVASLIFLCIGFFNNISFALLTVLFTCILFMLFYTINKQVKKFSNLYTKESINLIQIFVEYIDNFSFLFVSKRWGSIDRRYLTTLNRQVFYQFRTGLLNAFTNSAKEPLALIGVLTIYFFLTEFKGESTSALLISIMLFYRAFNSVMNAQFSKQSCTEGYGSIEELWQILNVKGIGVVNPRFGVIHGARIRNLYYSKEGFSILKGLTLEILPKKTYVLHGPSGSGKSTLVKILLGLLNPSEGSIRYLDQKQNELDVDVTQHSFGYIPQLGSIFRTTLIENLSLNSENSEEDYRKAQQLLRKVGLGYLLTRMNNVLDLVCDDIQLVLSGGEVQRLLFARQLFLGNDFIVIDEGTSALDKKSELLLLDILKELEGEFTLLIVAHSEKIIEGINNKIYIENGKAEQSE